MSKERYILKRVEKEGEPLEQQGTLLLEHKPDVVVEQGGLDTPHYREVATPKKRKKSTLLYISLALLLIAIGLIVAFATGLFNFGERQPERFEFTSHVLAPATVGEQYNQQITPAEISEDFIDREIVYSAIGLLNGLSLAQNATGIFLTGRIMPLTGDSITGEHTITIRASIENTEIYREADFSLAVGGGVWGKPLYEFSLEHGHRFCEDDFLAVTVSASPTALIEGSIDGDNFSPFTRSGAAGVFSNEFSVRRGEAKGLLIRYAEHSDMALGESLEITLSARLTDHEQYIIDSGGALVGYSDFFLAYNFNRHITILTTYNDRVISSVSWEALVGGDFLSVSVPNSITSVFGEIENIDICLSRAIIFLSNEPPRFSSPNRSFIARFIVPQGRLSAFSEQLPAVATGNIFEANQYTVRNLIISDMEINSIRKRVLVGYFGNSELVVLPTGIAVILENAFYNRENLSEIVLPNSLNIIQSGAFSRSTLQTVFFEGNQTRFSQIENYDTQIASDIVLFSGEWQFVQGVPARN